MDIPIVNMTQIVDIQSLQDGRNLAIDQVGIKQLRYPISVSSNDSDIQQTIAKFSLSVALPATEKGTHMSRFIEVLETYQQPFAIHTLQNFVQTLQTHMQSEQTFVELSFPYFIRKVAPKSGKVSLMDYDITLTACLNQKTYHQSLQLIIPVKTLCPASKEMAEYGAHSQRAHITLDLILTNPACRFEDFIQLVESQASAELFAILKRTDEKHITEHAYDHPKFVEDLIRDIALQLKQSGQVDSFTVECENFESIHNHSAFARITG